MKKYACLLLLVLLLFGVGASLLSGTVNGGTPKGTWQVYMSLFMK